MLSTLSVVAAVFAGVSAVSAQAQGTYPNATTLQLVAAQFNASGFDTPIASGLSFGVPLNAKALLRVSYPGIGLVQNGNPYTAAQVATKPDIAVWPAQGANISTTSKYTIMLADASAIGDPDAQGDYRHYLANSVGAPTGYAGSGAFNLTNGTVITYYAGPGPIAGTGAHRYAWMLFEQPATFAAPSNLSTSGVAPNHWDVHSYITSANLGNLIAASFFTVQNGDPTKSAVATTAVNTATLVVPTAMTSTGTAAVTGGAGAADAAPTTTKPNSAMATKVAGPLGAAIVGALLVFLA